MPCFCSKPTKPTAVPVASEEAQVRRAAFALLRDACLSLSTGEILALAHSVTGYGQAHLTGVPDCVLVALEQADQAIEQWRQDYLVRQQRASSHV